MADAPSSISSSDRPGRGLLFALALLAGIECFSRAAGFSASSASEDIDAFDRTHTPDLLILGDSKVGMVDFREIAAAYAPQGVTSGFVWSLAGTSPTAMMENLLARRITPRTLLLSASESLLMRDLLVESRGRMETPGFLEARTRPLRRALVEASFVIPEENGPSALGHAVLGLRRLFIDPNLWERERLERIQEHRRQERESNMRHARRWFTEEPRPSPEAIQAAVAVLRTLQRRGVRVVLVRTPLSAEMLTLENAWGVPEALARIAGEVGAPLTDINALPVHERLAPAVLDHFHLEGSVLESQLSAELGRIARSQP